MEKIVYILGAGFSAPLGLPVMSNFLVKAKDLLRENPTRYSYFKGVLGTIDKMHVCLSFYDADLLNIEEVLSIMEMQSSVGEGTKRRFKEFITDVIEASTPPLPFQRLKLNGQQWHSNNFVNDGHWAWNRYVGFVSLLFGLRFKVAGNYIDATPQPSESYSIITLNHDLVIETSTNYLNSAFSLDQHLQVKTDFTDEKEKKICTCELPYVKLHGCVQSGDIIPPTWNKRITKSMEAKWRMAHKLLCEANQIRIIGYSLPAADSYLKYLLKSAGTATPHLRSIDVLCSDPTGEVFGRYNAFIKFKFRRFKNAATEDYLHHLLCSAEKYRMVGYEGRETVFQDAHDDFMG
ncbi:MAG: hypothetical protein ACXWIU_14045 [Limisphaerales bacterium]